MKQITFIILFVFCAIISKAQSADLKAAYNQVTSTLKNYKYQSQDVYGSGDYAKTRSITLKIQSGNMIIAFTDSFGPFSDPIFGDKPGTKTIKVPLEKLKISLGGYNDNKIELSSSDGVEFSYKGKKELLEEYAICGEKLSCKKLCTELEKLLTIALEEDFKGTLGVTSSSTSRTKPTSKSKSTTTKTTKSKSAGKYVQ